MPNPALQTDFGYGNPDTGAAAPGDEEEFEIEEEAPPPEVPEPTDIDMMDEPATTGAPEPPGAPAAPPAKSAGPSLVGSAEAAEVPPEGSPMLTAAQERANRAMKLYDPGMGERRAAGPAPVQQKPPAQVAAEERARFEKEVFKQIGGDPFGRNTIAEITEHTKNDLPKLFQQVFRGQVIWEDRNRLDKNQAAFWANEVKAYRAHLKDQIEGEKKSQVEAYKQMMGRFDVHMKTQQAEQAKLQKRAADFAGNAEKKVSTAAKRIDTLAREERSIAGGLSKIMKAGKGENGQPLPEYQEEFNTLKKQLEQNRSEQHQIKMALDPTYKRNYEMKEKEKAQAAAASVENEKKAAEAKGQEERKKLEDVASEPHPKKGPPVQAKMIPGGKGVRVYYKDGSTEDRGPDWKAPGREPVAMDIHGSAFMND